MGSVGLQESAEGGSRSSTVAYRMVRLCGCGRPDRVHTPLYLLAHFDRDGFGCEAMSAIRDIVPVISIGTAFDVVVDMVRGGN